MDNVTHFQVKVEDGDPIQYAVWDIFEDKAVARYADKEKADDICRGLNENDPIE